MAVRRKLVETAILLLAAVLVYRLLPVYPGVVSSYDRYFFCGWQSARGWLLGWLPASIGDLLYFAAGIWLLFTIIKWGKYLFTFRRSREKLALSLLLALRTFLIAYIVFVAGWGANYQKQPLSSYWGLGLPDSAPANEAEQQLRRKKSTAELTSFAAFLVTQINEYAPHSRVLSIREVSSRASLLYENNTDTRVSSAGLRIKPSLYSYFMMWSGVEGYYNPFTGEGQVNDRLPRFVMPFLVCHEMAHQAGIASEEDANLLAYAVCTSSADSTFRYSAYLSIWLYAHGRLYRRDSAAANALGKMLNPLTRAHIDTFDEIDKKYQNQYARYSTDMYDRYLKLQAQKEGIRSYGNVTASAWALENKRLKSNMASIKLP